MATKKEKQAILEMLVRSTVFEAVTGKDFHMGSCAVLEDVAEAVGFSRGERYEFWHDVQEWVKKQPCSEVGGCIVGCHNCVEWAKEYAESRIEGRLTRAEYLEHLEDQEVISMHFEGCVGIHNGQVWQNGEVIREEPTIEELQILFQEEFNYEFGGMTAREVLDG